MTLEEGLYVYLQSKTDITNLVSTRVYPYTLPQEVTLPAITYSRNNTPRELTHDTSGSTGTLAKVGMQFDVYAETYAKVKQVTDALRKVLNGYSGTMGTAPNTIAVRAALVFDELADFQGDVGLYHMIASYTIWQEE